MNDTLFARYSLHDSNPMHEYDVMESTSQETPGGVATYEYVIT
jgi:hypothetical protein